MNVFDRGDIVLLNPNPDAAPEPHGHARLALVLTPKEFNRLGDALIAPIVQGGDHARYAGFAVPLTGGKNKTQGVALVNKIRAMDLLANGATKVERVSPAVISDALGRLGTLFE